MEVYEDLLNWARDQGIELNGIEPRPLPGRGIGVVATKSIKPNDLLLRVPTSSLRTHKTISKQVTSKLPSVSTTVHGRLAADFLLNNPPLYSAWNAVLPSREDVWASMPLTWDRHLHDFLPRTALTLLKKQESKFDRDWQAVHHAFPSITRNEYMYAWALVNTRTFYYETSSSDTRKLHRDDRIALQPVADLLNHTSNPADGCKVSFDTEGCTVRASREYLPGDEVYICYGNHGNDFLLTEYGFLLEENIWDEVCIDDAVLPILSARQKELLEEVGFLGNYMLDKNGVCYRTQVALRLVYLPLSEWRRFLDGEGEDQAQQEVVDRELRSILRKYRASVSKVIGKIEDSDVGQASQRDMLVLRWRQIGGLVDRTIEGLSG